MQNVPWRIREEFISCYSQLQMDKLLVYFNEIVNYSTKAGKNNIKKANFNEYLDEKEFKKGIKVLFTWTERPEKQSLVLATFMTIENLNNIGFYLTEENNHNHFFVGSLTLSLIQIVNLIIDDLKKIKKLSCNMFEIAKATNFPEYIIDLRHESTHKSTPDNNLVLIAFLDILKFLVDNFWKQIHEKFSNQIKKIDYLKALINNNSNQEEIKSLNHNLKNLKKVEIEIFDINNLIDYWLINNTSSSVLVDDSQLPLQENQNILSNTNKSDNNLIVNFSKIIVKIQKFTCKKSIFEILYKLLCIIDDKYWQTFYLTNYDVYNTNTRYVNFIIPILTIIIENIKKIHQTYFKSSLKISIDIIECINLLSYKVKTLDLVKQLNNSSINSSLEILDKILNKLCQIG